MAAAPANGFKRFVVMMMRKSKQPSWLSLSLAKKLCHKSVVASSPKTPNGKPKRSIGLLIKPIGKLKEKTLVIYNLWAKEPLMF